RKSSIEKLSAKYSKSVATGTRVPRKTGTPPMVSGSTVIGRFPFCSITPISHVDSRGFHLFSFRTEKLSLAGPMSAVADWWLTHGYEGHYLMPANFRRCCQSPNFRGRFPCTGTEILTGEPSLP